MLKDIKLGFKLLKYGYKLKLNVILLALFAIIGIASDIMSKGTSIIGGVYFSLMMPRSLYLRQRLTHTISAYV